MDVMDTIYQLVQNGFGLDDLNEIPLYEMEMLVIVISADKEKRSKG